jgi:hypothetical protein
MGPMCVTSKLEDDADRVKRVEAAQDGFLVVEKQLAVPIELEIPHLPGAHHLELAGAVIDVLQDALDGLHGARGTQLPLQPRLGPFNRRVHGSMSSWFPFAQKCNTPGRKCDANPDDFPKRPSPWEMWRQKIAGRARRLVAGRSGWFQRDHFGVTRVLPSAEEHARRRKKRLARIVRIW